MSGEKTEQPTDKRLRESREKGDVPKSTEIVSAAGVAGALVYFISFGDSIYTRISQGMDFTFQKAAVMEFDEAFHQIGGLFLNIAISLVLPMVAIVMSCTLIALMAQIGFLVAPKAAMPKLSNLSPSKWFKKVFSMKNAFEFVKNLLKVTVLSASVYLAIKNNGRTIFTLPQADDEMMLVAAGHLLKTLLMYTILTFSAIAAIDFLYTRFKYTKDHMMSKDEVKREYKEMEGDPMIKSKRKQLHREMLNQNTIAKTRKSKVLIVNPTHYAVAIDYDKKKTPLPVVVAKGEGDLALRMIEAAKEENIPIMREPPLARALFAQSEEDAFVPDDLLLQVAEVLKFVRTLDSGRS
ncbi:MAG: type III secretion system export apparatus subunit SctU [Succinivibrionaceae bacterium]|nr:type III secretion system export apparatus subunit SctU [Succinivibrionaceae bacterium]